ncbi:unnamed protein product [Moneuplotes crassus]|uniref:Uncharacterized protein n=1 Tax=Euplotes crassus TaxID=5936 RepID=A0AAD1XM62_EUPCR|nr:unnamed protein product [Moneuplotes crassus]
MKLRGFGDDESGERGEQGNRNHLWQRQRVLSKAWQGSGSKYNPHNRNLDQIFKKSRTSPSHLLLSNLMKPQNLKEERKEKKMIQPFCTEDSMQPSAVFEGFKRSRINPYIMKDKSRYSKKNDFMEITTKCKASEFRNKIMNKARYRSQDQRKPFQYEDNLICGIESSDTLYYKGADRMSSNISNKRSISLSNLSEKINSARLKDNRRKIRCFENSESGM